MKEDFLSEAKSTLIDLIKKRGEISVSIGAAELGLAKTTVRQHLTSLEAKGFLQTRRQRHGRGRPRKMYSLTEKSEMFFDTKTSEFLMGFLRDLIERGHGELIMDYIDRVSEKTLEDMQKDGFEADELLIEVHELLRRRGFMPKIDRNEGRPPCLTLRNCPYRDVVDVTTHICTAERAKIERLLSKRLKRVEHMASGDNVCRYHILED